MNLIEQELAWRKFVKDPCEGVGFWHIAIPGKGMQPFKPYKEQIEVLHDFVNERKVIVLKARQIGMTTLISFFAYWYAVAHPDSRIVIVSRRQTDATKIVKKIKQGYKLLPDWMKFRCPITTDTQQKLGFENGSEIESIPSRENAARGDSVDIIIVDEWGFLNDPEEAWKSIEPTADVGGRIFGFSTPSQYATWWHTFCEDAKHGKNGFKYRFLSWSVATHRDDAWYTQKKAEASSNPALFESEYAADDVSCWVKSGGNVFDHARLPKREDMTSPVGVYHVGGYSVSQLVQSPEGPLAIWEMPKAGSLYLLSADVAKGTAKSDFNSVSVLKKELNGRIRLVASWHGKCDIEIYAEQIAKLSAIYNNGLIVPERNGQFGVALCEALEDKDKFGRVNLYLERDGKGVKKYSGFITNSNKIVLISNLRTLIYSRDLIINDVMTLEELKSYIDLGNGKLGAPRGANDDRVMSLAIGCFISLTHLKYKEVQVKEEPDVNLGLPGSIEEWFPNWANTKRTKYVNA